MNKVFVAAKDPVGAALRVVLEFALGAEPAADAEQADVVLTCTDEETVDALEAYPEVPVWQAVFGSRGVTHRRVRQFDGLNLVVALAEALKEEQ